MSFAHPLRHIGALAALAAVTILFAHPSPAFAASMKAATPAAATQAVSSSGHVTILVLDMSGSMSQNDPNGLRCSAANAYIDLSTVGDDVGVVDLTTTSNARGGKHNFVTAQVIAQPTEMATVAARQALRQRIASVTNNCAPLGNTPTYDALSQALGMLTSATQNGKISGSVVLLTDGQPFPDTDQQIAAIQSDLLPQFKSHGWPIDTVALGSDTSFFGFLSGLSNATAGKFYNDGKGPVPGVSPLNLATFFVDIFAIRNGRTPGQTIPPTTLGGSTVQRNFSVGAYVAHLDVIAIKDQPGTTVTLTAPGGQTIPPATAGTFVATDPHYVIFSLDSPQQGAWQLNVTGSGQFLMDSLIVSTLSLAITQPAAGKALPLGQPVTLTADLTDAASGAGVGGTFDVRATVSYAGNGSVQPVEITLSDTGATGIYSGTLTIPTSAPAGSYDIDASARSVTETAVETHEVAQFTLFPTPELISPSTGNPVADAVKNPVSAHVVTWDPVLQFTYSTVPGFSWDLFGWRPSDWPLQGLAAHPQALVNGVVLVGSQNYNGATVTATARDMKTGATVPLTVTTSGSSFQILWPENTRGTFAVTLTAHGQFKDTFGDLVTTPATVIVTIGLPSLADELRAWGITLFYLAALAVIFVFGIYGPVNYTVRAKPSRRNRLVDLATNRLARRASELDFGTPLVWKGWSLRRYFAPDHLPASEVALPDNLQFIFRRGNEVAVRVKPPHGKEIAAAWRLDGRPLTHEDGTLTILPAMRLAMTESGQTTEWAFEQDVKRVEEVGSPLADRVADLAGSTALGERLRRGRSIRND
jgi:hypothetical protein